MKTDAPTCTKELFRTWCIRYLVFAMAHSLCMHVLGGKVEKAPVREYGKTETFVDKMQRFILQMSLQKTIVLDEPF